MTQEQILAYATAARILVTIGGQTIAAVRAMFAASGRTEEELNAILDEVIHDATMRKAISDAEAGQ